MIGVMTGDDGDDGYDHHYDGDDGGDDGDEQQSGVGRTLCLSSDDQTLYLRRTEGCTA